MWLLGECPAGDHGRDGQGGHVAGRLEAAARDEGEGGQPGENRHRKSAHAWTGEQAMEERAGVGVQYREPAQRERSGEQPGTDGARSEPSYEVGVFAAGGVRGEKDGWR